MLEGLKTLILSPKVISLEINPLLDNALNEIIFFPFSVLSEKLEPSQS